MTNKPPEKIYLQWYNEDEAYLPEEYEDLGGMGVTWCEDEIFDSDVPYIRDPNWKPPQPTAEDEEE